MERGTEIEYNKMVTSKIGGCDLHSVTTIYFTIFHID